MEAIVIKLLIMIVSSTVAPFVTAAITRGTKALFSRVPPPAQHALNLAIGAMCAGAASVMTGSPVGLETAASIGAGTAVLTHAAVKTDPAILNKIAGDAPQAS